MKRSNRMRARRPLAVIGLGLALVASLAVGACAPAEPETPVPSATDKEPVTFDPATETWDPASFVAATPGVVGWQSVSTGGGALVALSADGTATVIWSSSPNEGLASNAIAVDPGGPQVLCVVSQVDSAAASIASLALLGADASVEQLPMPEGHEGVIGAAFLPDGRPLVVAYHATTETFETQLGTYSEAGVWQPVTLGGTLPEYQFVEGIFAVPGTDAIALVLKTPGGTGDRDDEALVLARFADDALTAYTTEHRADALVGASPLWGAEGVVYPRTPSVNGLPDVVDLVRVDWKSDAWTETVIAEGLPIASGVETGLVAAHAPNGRFWVRTMEEGPHGAGTSLGEFDPEQDVLVPTVHDLSVIDWFAWFEPVGS